MDAIGFVASSAVTGAALFTLAFFTQVADEGVVLGALAVGAVWLGGSVAAQLDHGRVAPAVAATVVVLASRVAAGTWTALALAIALPCGAVLRVRSRDVRRGLATIGAVVAIAGGARLWLLLVFWALGLLVHAARHGVVAVRTRVRRRAVAGRTPQDPGSVTVIWS
jgi:hypothetical protein